MIRVAMAGMARPTIDQNEIEVVVAMAGMAHPTIDQNEIEVVVAMAGMARPTIDQNEIEVVAVISKFLKDSWLVLLAALVFGLGCSGIHGQLKPRIEQNARDKIARELRVLFGEETTVDEVIDPADPDGKRVLYYKASQNDETIGYALQANGGGFADKIILLVAVDAEFENLKGIAVLKSNETPGFGDKIKNAKFKDQFGNCPMGQKLIVTKRGDRGVVDYRIVSITGATISSQAVVDIVNGGAERLKEIVKQ